jgi:phospholipase/carboxylesterase
MVRDEFDRLISNVVKQQGFEGRLQQVAFVGVSQGAIMALDAVASGRWKVGALVSFSGLLPLRPVVTTDRTPILLVHGESDPSIPATAPKAAAGLLRTAGFDVTLDVIPGVGHTISLDGAQQALLLLMKKFAI